MVQSWGIPEAVQALWQIDSTGMSRLKSWVVACGAVPTSASPGGGLMTTTSLAETKPAGPRAWTRTSQQGWPVSPWMDWWAGRQMGSIGRASQVLAATGISGQWIGRRRYQAPLSLLNMRRIRLGRFTR